MVLTKDELIGALRHEVKILLHLVSKLDQEKVDYRPTPKQRSTLELLRYLAIMGPTQVSVIKGGVFTRESMGAAWGPAEAASKNLTFDETVATIQRQGDDYIRLLSDWTEDDFRSVVDMFGWKNSRGALLVSLVLNAHAAYRMQLFCYLKACGREELGTMDLWAGTDAMPTS